MRAAAKVRGVPYAQSEQQLTGANTAPGLTDGTISLLNINAIAR